MQISQEKFFEGLNFKKHKFTYEFSDMICYKGSDGGYYRIDRFSDSYVIEYAENEDEAQLNRFEDADLYDAGLEEAELIRQIQNALKEYVLE